MLVIEYNPHTGCISLITRKTDANLSIMLEADDSHPCMRDMNKWTVSNGTLVEKVECTISIPKPIKKGEPAEFDISPIPRREGVQITNGAGAVSFEFIVENGRAYFKTDTLSEDLVYVHVNNDPAVYSNREMFRVE